MSDRRSISLTTVVTVAIVVTDDDGGVDRETEREYESK